MCLAIPGKVVSKHGSKGKVDFGGVVRDVDLSLLEKVDVGEFVLVHVGFAIQLVDEETAREAYRLLEDWDELDESLPQQTQTTVAGDSR